MRKFSLVFLITFFLFSCGAPEVPQKDKVPSYLDLSVVESSDVVFTGRGKGAELHFHFGNKAPLVKGYVFDDLGYACINFSFNESRSPHKWDCSLRSGRLITTEMQTDSDSDLELSFYNQSIPSLEDDSIPGNVMIYLYALEEALAGGSY